jgi:hypothetical protein
MIAAEMKKFSALMDFTEAGGSYDHLVEAEKEKKLDTLVNRIGETADLLQHKIIVPGKRIEEQIHAFTALTTESLGSTSDQVTKITEVAEGVREENVRFAQKLKALKEESQRLIEHQQGLESHLRTLQAAAAAPQGSTFCDFLSETGTRTIHRGSGVKPVPQPLITRNTRVAVGPYHTSVTYTDLAHEKFNEGA